MTDGNDFDNIDLDHAVSTNAKTDQEPVIYTKTGEVSQSEQTTSISISV